MLPNLHYGKIINKFAKKYKELTYSTWDFITLSNFALDFCKNGILLKCTEEDGRIGGKNSIGTFAITKNIKNTIFSVFIRQ